MGENTEAPIHGYENEMLVGKKSDPRGRMRGLTIDPWGVFELLRDTYKNIPIPPDAKFEGISIEKKGPASYIAFYYSTDLSNKAIIVKPTDVNLNPMGHCFILKPQLLVDILKYYCDGRIPKDAEAKAFSINQRFNLIRIDIYSDKFKVSDAAAIPLIHLRYEAEQLFSSDSNGESRHIVGKDVFSGVN